MDIRLNGKTALITGGSRGLGQAMAERFAEAGARVAIIARRPDVLEEARQSIEKRAKDKVAAFSYDLTDAAACQAAHAETVSALGPVDILVNNVGGHRSLPFLDADVEQFEADMTIKLYPAIRLAQLVIPQMREQKWGRILNTLATAARHPPAQSLPTSATRAAGLAFTKALANEFGQDGILVNAMLVGIIESEQIHNNIAKAPNPDEIREMLINRIPLGRLGKAEEFANMACFLASENASYINGCAINVDGGMSPVP